MFSPHVLRHAFASLAAQAGVSWCKIGAWMGHTRSEVTEIHAHLAQYDQDIERLNSSGRQPGEESLMAGGIFFWRRAASSWRRTAMGCQPPASATNGRQPA